MTPGDRVRALIEDLGLDQSRFAERIDVSRQTISNIVNGHQTISREMANRLARLSGHTPGYWLQDDIGEDRPKASGPGACDTPVNRAAFPAGVLVNHQIRRALESRLIEIDPSHPSLVQTASVDLRLDDFLILAGGESFDISGGRSYLLKPGETVNVTTKESIRLPDTMVARVGAMTAVARFGIIMAHGFQIDPGYEGNLQFCLFNASGRNFELVSNAPIISIEFTSLAERPSPGVNARGHDRGEVMERFGAAIPPAKCDALIRDGLRTYVKTTPARDGVIAEVPELDIQHRNRTATAATDDTIQEMLTTLRTSAAQPKYRDLHARYLAFFAEVATHMFFGADAMRIVALTLGLPVDDGMLDLGNGEYLPLPQGSSEISLAKLATKLGVQPAELVVRLTRPTKPAASAVTMAL